ncbi:MAG: extracellular solute-binding protein [Chloroflexi bacterium]|nr:extracellular solute-binding protein [Chloroflexota bacterium]
MAGAAGGRYASSGNDVSCRHATRQKHTKAVKDHNTMNRISRRSLIAGATSAAGVVLAAACGAGPGPSSPAGQPAGGQKLTGTFELWQPWPIEQPTHGGPIGWKQLMDGYNSKGGPKVNITTPAGNFNTGVQTAFAAGDPPDAWQADQQWTVVWAAKGFSAPLDDLMKRDKWDKNQIFPSALETMSWQGKYWAIMQHPDIVFMWYASGLMEENGISARSLPATWTQLDEAAIKLTKKDADGWAFVGLIPHLGTNWQVIFPQANGAKLVSDDGKKAQFDSQEVIEAIEWAKTHLKRLGGFDAVEAWRKVVPGGDNAAPGSAAGANDIFGQKRMAALLGGNWTADNIRRMNKRSGSELKFSVAPVPSGPKGPRDPKANVYSGGILIAAQKGGKKLDLAWDFFKYVGSKEGGLNVQRNTADVAANKEAARDPAIVNDPVTGLGRKEFYTLFEQGSGSRTIKHPAAVEINSEYNKPINDYLRDNIGNLRDGMKEANRLAQQKIDEFWSQNPNAGR